MSSPIFCKVEEAASIFSDIRNYLAGRVIGITRDSALLHEVVKCLFCSLSLKDSLSGESSAVDVSEAYRREFRLIKNKLTFAFDPDEEILLDPQTILYVHQKLIKINLLFLGDILVFLNEKNLLKSPMFVIAANTRAAKPAAGPLTLNLDPLKNPMTIPPIIPDMIPLKKGAPLANEIPKHNGKATKNTTIPAEKSVITFLLNMIFY